MATLIVTLSRLNARRTAVAPVAQGSSCRTETITFSTSTNGALTADGEEIVELLADADCLVAIGTSPHSTLLTDGTGTARKLKANIPYQFGIQDGEKVAVEAA